MSVTLKPKNEITIPKSIRRKAGIKHGDRFDFRVSGRVISIVPKLSPDELQDESEIRDPKIRAIIRGGFQEFLEGRARPAEMLQKELEKIAQTQAASKSYAPQRRRKA